MKSKKHKLLRTYCWGMIGCFFINLFFFGSILPFLIAGAILFITILLIDLRKSSKSELGIQESYEQAIINQNPSSLEPNLKTRFCAQCGTMVSGNFCESCGTKIE